MNRRNIVSMFLFLVVLGPGMLLGLLGDRVGEKFEATLESFRQSAGLSSELFWVVLIGSIFLLSVFGAYIKERFDAGSKEAAGAAGEQTARERFIGDVSRRYDERYLHKLDERYEIPLLVSAYNERKVLFPAEDYITKRFEDDGRLMIIGNRGSGKTGLLLKLARYLAQKAKSDPKEPVPVIFNLASWTPSHQSFADWVKQMLVKGYGLSDAFAEELQRERSIIYLLDGLDEVGPKDNEEEAARLRAECIDSLDGILREGSISTVICCKSKQMDAILAKYDLIIPIKNIIEIQDLTSDRIDLALENASHTKTDRFAATNLQEALKTDTGGLYKRVLATPFYFTTALQVFDSTKRSLDTETNQEEIETKLVTDYLEKKFDIAEKEKKNNKGFSRAQTKVWLGWLARSLGDRVTFELSDLQPSMLRGPWLYRLLFVLVFAGLGGLITGLQSGQVVVGITMAIIFALVAIFTINTSFWRWTIEPFRWWWTWTGLVFFAFVIYFLTLFLLVIARIVKAERPELAFAMDSYQAFLMVAILVVAFVTSILAAINVRLAIRLISGMIGGVPLRDIHTEDFGYWTIAPLKRLESWIAIWRSGVELGLGGSLLATITSFAFILTVVIIVIYNGIQTGLPPTDLGEIFVGLLMMFVIIIFGVIGFPLGFIVGICLGFLRACRETFKFVSINSAYQRLRAGIFFNIIQFFLFAWFLFLIAVGIPESVDVWTFLPSQPVIVVSILIGLFQTALVRHIFLRICLKAEGATPLRYLRFLDYATSLGVLEREGGQWRFRHQILQDYLAGDRKAR